MIVNKTERNTKFYFIFLDISIIISIILIFDTLQVLHSLYSQIDVYFKLSKLKCSMLNSQCYLLSRWRANSYFTQSVTIMPECPALLSIILSKCVSGYIYVILSSGRTSLLCQNWLYPQFANFAQIFATFHLWSSRPAWAWSMTAGDFKPQPLPSRSLARSGDKWRKLSRLPDIF